MANAASLVLTEGAPSTLNNPASGYGALAVDASNHIYTLSSAGVIWQPVINASITADAAIANTDTLVKSLAIPAGLLAVAGTDILIQGSGSMVAGAAAASVFTVRAGTAGTTSDASICALTLANSGTTGTTAFFFNILVTCRAVGAGAGTTTGTIAITNNSTTTGIIATATGVVTATGSSLALTTPTFVDLSYISGSASNTCTFKTANISIYCP